MPRLGGYVATLGMACDDEDRALDAGYEIVSMLHTLASSAATMTTTLDEHFGPGD
jgi:hypothetical protein